MQDPPLTNASPPDPDSPRDPNPPRDAGSDGAPAGSPRAGSDGAPAGSPRAGSDGAPAGSPRAGPDGAPAGSPHAGSDGTPPGSPDPDPTVEIGRGTGAVPPTADRRTEGEQTAPIGARPVQGATPSGPGPRWGEAGYRAPPDTNRSTRVAVAWILGGIGAVVVALFLVVGLAVILLAGGQHQETSTGAAPGGAPFPTDAVPTTATPNGPTTAPGSAPPPSAGGSRTRNADYSIRVPDGYQDVTESWRTEHPEDRNAVQVLAGAPGSPATTRSTIVISQLPNGADQGRPLNRLMTDRLRTLRGQGARSAGQPRNTSIGADPAVEADLTQGVSGELTHRTEVLAIHDGRVWEIAVTSPDGSQALAAQAWLTVRNGWQWQ